MPLASLTSQAETYGRFNFSHHLAFKGKSIWAGIGRHSICSRQPPSATDVRWLTVNNRLKVLTSKLVT